MGATRKSGGGHFGFGLSGDADAHQFFQNIVHGCMLVAPTTGSTIDITGTAHDFNVDVTAGVIVCGGFEKEVVLVDVDLAHGSGGALLANGESIYYTLVASLDLNNAIQLVWMAGTIALDAAAVPLTHTQLLAGFDSERPWFVVGDTKLACGGDTTLVQTYYNAGRPLLLDEDSVHSS
jgi:hypothetical protein